MTDRRSGPPLFDLMRERGQDPHAPKPTPNPNQNPSDSNAGESIPAPSLAPPHASAQVHPSTQAIPQSSPSVEGGSTTPSRQTAWDSSGGVSRAERSAAAAMFDEDTQSDSGIRLSSPMFYALIVIALALVIGAWTVGYQRGNKAGKEEMSQLVDDQPVVRPLDTGTQPDPIVNQPVVNQPTQRTPNTNPDSNPASNSTTNPATQPTGAGILSASGYLTSDPREPGLNYLVLATLNAEQAANAISFMYSHAIAVIGVPVVDSGARGANNPSRYTLYSLGVAIPGNQWSAMSSARMQHQRQIADLGARWQAEQRGASDFSQTNWEKYDP